MLPIYIASASIDDSFAYFHDNCVMDKGCLYNIGVCVGYSVIWELRMLLLLRYVSGCMFK